MQFRKLVKKADFLYILNMDAGQGTTPIILFAASEENNATNLILRKLGVDPDKIEAAAPAGKPATTATPAATAKPAATAPAATPKKK